MDTRLREDIKFNCNVSDARYWGHFSICGLLLRYRDLYRSEHGLKAWTNISRTDIGAWIESKEAAWPELERQGFRDLMIGEAKFEPFEVERINRALTPRGLVYGAGYGMYMKPTFFLAELRSIRKIRGLTVYISGPESVRDLLTAPAMLQGDTIFVRLEPLSMLLHFKFSELNIRRNAALEDAFARYGFSHRQLVDETFERRLSLLAERYAEIILLHEVAEHHEEVPEWKDILAAAGDRKNEHYLRAVKDLVADTSTAGPLKQIVQSRDAAALTLSVALLDGFHRALFSEIRDVHREFVNNGDWDAVEEVRANGHARFIAERDRIVNIYRKSGTKEQFADQLRKSISL